MLGWELDRRRRSFPYLGPAALSRRVPLTRGRAADCFGTGYPTERVGLLQQARPGGRLCFSTPSLDHGQGEALRLSILGMPADSPGRGD
jgi:hypothetical protein